ncbi:MAG: nucleoside-diphosphate kinase [Candidatus Dojkabacteria bacterium]
MVKNHVERSLVILKPDAVQRGLSGEIISRFEKKGLKLIAMKMVWPTMDQAKRHYDQPESAMMMLGERTLAAYKEKGIEMNKTPIEIAKHVQKKLLTYLTTGPVIVMVIEGAHAIAHIRKIRGGTNPLSADVGSITADYSIDSFFIADDADRAIRNLVHASGTVEEAANEIKIWFTNDEIFSYDLAIEKILYSTDWEKTRDDLVNKK